MSISYPVDKRLSRFTRLAMVVRAGDWWAYKIAIILATGYATADVLGVSPVSLWQTFLFLLLSLVPLAAFASLINDLSDIAEDRIAGKRNHLDGMSRLRVLGLFAASLIPGIAIAASLRQTPGLVVIYAANWLIFALYSVPPVRLKSRALLGIIAIALGESFLPHLFALFLTAAAVTREAPPPLDRTGRSLVFYCGDAEHSLAPTAGSRLGPRGGSGDVRRQSNPPPGGLAGETGPFSPRDRRIPGNALHPRSLGGVGAACGVRPYRVPPPLALENPCGRGETREG